MIARLQELRRAERDLRMILEARQISRQAALNAIAYIVRERTRALNQERSR